ncbi:MAG: ATP phosphoribosyltransferase [Chloroflexi bacterium]|nr:ATP phosphoribosyltransferase [Chloroflexota bacterium]
MSALTIALAKGRLLEPSISLFESFGYALDGGQNGSRSLIVEAESGGVRFLFAKASDVPVYVEYGAADIGIVGQDVLREMGSNVYEPLVLNYGQCRLVVAGKPEHRDADWRLVTGLRVATKYPRLADKFFSSRGLTVEIIGLYGSVELAPRVGLADLIVDVVDTGRTLKENGLVELEQVLKCQATLIVNRASHTLRVTEIRDLIERISATEIAVRS